MIHINLLHTVAVRFFLLKKMKNEGKNQLSICVPLLITEVISVSLSAKKNVYIGHYASGTGCFFCIHKMRSSRVMKN